jgi:hypothetical protein
LSWFVLVASLGTNHAKPFGPELQVKRMLYGRAFARNTFFEIARHPWRAKRKKKNTTIN